MLTCIEGYYSALYARHQLALSVNLRPRIVNWLVGGTEKANCTMQENMRLMGPVDGLGNGILRILGRRI